ncbi:HD family phosphohydrolase [Microaerobacter geothermalis]|uniref:HD family phosphohydrolase n=1 Tax=Microaerobacter geothermalis TaxID=674972 RepID=UPI001F1BAC3F|nr:HD family phosphohydrolase [Microaerobacter geothermalis]MCF6092824.1 HD family phosphohydrolase [Microaerobacter geothermalis]
MVKKSQFKISFQDKLLRWKESRFFRTFFFLILGVVIFIHLMGRVTPETYDYTIGSVVEKDILSPITIEDKEATQKLMDKAASEVSPIYKKDDTITANQLDVLDSIFAKAKELSVNGTMSVQEKVDKIKLEIPYELSKDSYITLVSLAPETISTIRAITKNIVSEILLAGVKEVDGGVKRAIERVNEQLVSVDLESSARKVAQELARGSIVPNVLYNQEETNRLRLEARQNVQPVIIEKGQILLESNQVITKEVYRQLNLVGLLSKKVNYWPYAGLFLLVVILVLFLYLYMEHKQGVIAKDNSYLLIYVLIFSINLVGMKVVSLGQNLEYTSIGFLAPVAFASILITLLIDMDLAIITSVVFMIIASLMFNGELLELFDFRYGIAALVSSTVGAFSLGKVNRRSSIFKAGFYVSLANMVVILLFAMLLSKSYNVPEVAVALVYGAMSGLISAILAMGMLPIFEGAFGILSVLKLIELSNPNHPLLRKLLIETPGTYHHSVVVGNLSEAAAEAIGANGLLARVGSYYHDIGKTKRPRFFIENQFNMENPHDKISPSLSKTIIIAHPYDGVNMLKEYKIPKPIQDIAEQHHGTTLLKYFYHKAKQQTSGEVLESDYRYPGPKAQSKEAAIVGICDSVEAAIRSMSKVNPDKIESLVRKIIKDRLDDGQLNECDLTFKELELITKSICETLNGTFHSRIEYPKDEKEIEVKRA